MRGFAAGDHNLEEGLLSIVRADRGFDPEGFLKGARQAYEMIVTAFAEGNRKALRSLLSKEVFDGFAGAISDRLFHSRRGPVSAVLYGSMLLGSLALLPVMKTGAVGWIVVFMSLCIIGVHGMLSGTASMAFTTSR